MSKTIINISRTLAATLLALVVVIGMLPTAALAADPTPPDWNFLFAIFKNVDADVTGGTGNTAHIKYVMSQEEVDTYRGNAKDFEDFLTDIILNRAKGDAKTGTGVCPAAWQCPPHIFREQLEWTVPSSVTGIDAWAFQGYDTITRLTIPGSIDRIGAASFQDCTRLSEVTILPGVTCIGMQAFNNCTALTKVTIPAGVTSIEIKAFQNTGIKDVSYEGTQAQWKAIKIDDYNDALIKATIHCNSPVSVQPQQPARTATNDSLLVDGKPVEAAAYNIDGSNYFKLRDVAALLNGTPKQFNVGYDNATKSVTITTGQGYTKTSGDLQGKPAAGGTATISNNKVPINGAEASLTVYNINGNNYFKLRDLGKALDFNVGWSKDKGIYIEANKSYSDAD